MHAETGSATQLRHAFLFHIVLQRLILLTRDKPVFLHRQTNAFLNWTQRWPCSLFFNRSTGMSSPSFGDILRNVFTLSFFRPFLLPLAKTFTIPSWHPIQIGCTTVPPSSVRLGGLLRTTSWKVFPTCVEIVGCSPLCRRFFDSHVFCLRSDHPQDSLRCAFLIWTISCS